MFQFAYLIAPWSTGLICFKQKEVGILCWSCSFYLNALLHLSSAGFAIGAKLTIKRIEDSVAAVITPVPRKQPEQPRLMAQTPRWSCVEEEQLGTGPMVQSFLSEPLVLVWPLCVLSAHSVVVVSVSGLSTHG